MSGDPAKSLLQFRDGGTNFQLRDHTYFGNGCQNEWGQDGEGGSDIPCSSRIAKDGNNENQKIGTYYHFQAATSGSGGPMTSESENLPTPDTFCPLGWQLPYSGTGGDYYDKSKSLRKLFDTYSITYNDGGITQVNKVRSYPFSFIYSGSYHWTTGRLYYLEVTGRYWTGTVINTTGAYRLNIWPTIIRPADTDSKNNGQDVRCVNNFRSLRRRHGGRNRYTNGQR